MINHCLKILLRNSNNKLWSILSFIMIFLYPYSIHCRNSFVPTTYISYSDFRDLKDMEYQRRIQCLESNEAGQWVTLNNNGETQQYNIRYVDGRAVALDLKQYTTLVLGTNEKKEGLISKVIQIIKGNFIYQKIQLIKEKLTKKSISKNTEPSIDDSEEEKDDKNKKVSKRNWIKAEADLISKNKLITNKKPIRFPLNNQAFTLPFQEPFSNNGISVNLPAAQRQYPIVYFRFKKPEDYEDQTNADTNEKSIEDYRNT